ncbi:MAG: hypothetical protein AB1898_17230 [Acidobacteriota bacterium]
MKIGSVVVLSLHSPKEKVWGQLTDLTSAGVTIYGIDLATFEDWLNRFGSEEGTGFATVFYPLYRVERIALDEPVAMVPSLAERFQQRTGQNLHEFLPGNL